MQLQRPRADWPVDQRLQVQNRDTLDRISRQL